MFGSKFWEEIFGEQILLNEKKNFFFFFFGGGGGGGGRGGGQNGEQFLLKQILRKFLGPSFGGEILVRRKFRLQKYFGGFL